MKLLYITLGAVFLITLAVFSKSAFVSNIPNGSVNSCNTCHPNGNTHQFNTFGNASKSYLSSGKINWSAQFATLDSDGDGFTNGEELQDPEGTWQQGNPAPGEASLVTNPGDASSFPNTSFVEDFPISSGFKINSIYPNPITESSHFEFSLTKSGYLKIELFDYSGYLSAILYQGVNDIGNYDLNISSQSVANSGQYFLKISFNKFMITQKILIIK
ncbi:MAG: T9SS type A sorting domain-containing protein [bacterium]